MLARDGLTEDGQTDGLGAKLSSVDGRNAAIYGGPRIIQRLERMID